MNKYQIKNSAIGRDVFVGWEFTVLMVYLAWL